MSIWDNYIKNQIINVNSIIKIYKAVSKVTGKQYIIKEFNKPKLKNLY